MKAAASDFATLQASLPPLEQGDELVFRDDDGAACALLRQKRGEPRNFVFENGATRELRLFEDDGIPAARLCADTASLCAALEPAIGPVCEPRLVAWRPGKRAVLRMRRGETTVFVKLLDKKTYKRARSAFERMRAAEMPLRLALPESMLHDHCAYAAVAAPGKPLHDMLADGQTPPWRLVDRAVRSLACAPCPEDLPRQDFASARDSAVKMLGRAACVDDRCARLAERVATLRAPQQTHEGFVHGDLHDKQLFLAGDAAWLIDLEGCSRGDSNFDLVNLAEHLRLRALQRHGKDDGLCDSFLDRFAISRELRMAWGLCIRSRLIGVYAMRPRHAQVVSALFHSVAANLLERP